MDRAFHIYNPNVKDVQVRDDKILPDPVTLGVTSMVVDGKTIDITATSGVEQYVIVDPGEYPIDAAGRWLRSGSEPAKR